MGKGDRRTKRGKIWRGSYGKYRSKKSNKKHPETENNSAESEKE